MMTRYDENKNGKLEKDEWSKMRSSYANADGNKDSVITLDELTQHLKNFSSGNSSNSSSTASTSSRDGGGGRDWRRGGEGERGGGRGSWDRERSGRDAGPSRKSYRFLSADERVSAQLSGSAKDWFLKTDEDNDGQVSMVEYAASWTDERVREFQELDANNDGIITPSEYLQSNGDSSR